MLKNTYESKLVKHKAVAIDGILECVTIEINLKNQSNILISCIYRAPGQTLPTFCENIETIVNNDYINKTMLVCGDFSIDLLQHETHDCVRQFLDLMYSLGLYPLITKPTRISQNTATLIDNIFTTDIEQHYTCGLFINDISDHLPIFAVGKYINKNEAKKKQYKMGTPD